MLTGLGLSYKTKQFFFVLIKLSIVTGAAYFIYNKLLNNDELDFSVFVQILAKNERFLPKTVIFLLFLTIFNWFFEIKKWQNLVQEIKKISFFEALKQSLASLTASLITPNRIGEYAAKAIYFKGEDRSKVLLLNLISNMAQMSVTVLFGTVGVLLLLNSYEVSISYFKILRLITYVVIFISIIGFGLIYKNISIRGIDTKQLVQFIKSVSIRTHLSTISFSVLRYLIFSFQFFYMLQLFDVQLNYLDSMVIISSMYLLVSIIPTLFVLDVIVKGSVALFLFDLAQVNNLVVLCVTTLMWLLNFVLPSVFGSFFVLNFKMNRTFKTNAN